VIIDMEIYKANSDPEKKPSEAKKIKAMSRVRRLLAERIIQYRIYKIESPDKEL
jgi:hypothetical protein